MYCPQCGTKGVTSAQRFCRECGAEIGPASGQHDEGTAGTAQRLSDQSWHASSALPPRPMLAHVTVKDSAMKTLLMAAGLLLALPLLFGAVIAVLAVGFALAHVVFHLAPLLLFGLVIFWMARRRHGGFQPGRHHHGAPQTM